MHFLWEFRRIGGHYGIGGRGRYRYNVSLTAFCRSLAERVAVTLSDLSL